MSLDLHLPLIGHRFGLAAQIPTIPDVVYGPSLLGQDATVHAAANCSADAPFRTDPLLALARGAKWCARRCCWPGGRCGCGLPSGPSDTCRRCGGQQESLERRLGDAA